MGKLKRKMMEIKNIEIKKISGNPYQTRLFLEKEPLLVLAKSIRERGLFNPITVLENKNNYIVVHGHRRLEACKKLKWKKIPAFVKPRQDRNSLITDLIHENLIREDLSVQEKALSIKLLFSQIKGLKNDIDMIISCISTVKLYKQRGPRKNEDITEYKISTNDMFMGMKLLKTIGMNPNNAINYLTILKLPTEIQNKVSFNVHNDCGERSTTRISIRMAYNLARIKDKVYQQHLLERAFAGCSARHIQALVDNYLIKVLKGEWKGYIKKANNLSLLKRLDSNLLMSLSTQCNNLSKKLNTFKLTKLLALAEVLENEMFIMEATSLRKEMRLLDVKLEKCLEDKGYKNIEHHNEIFEIHIKEKHGCVRATIPKKMLKRIGIKLDSKQGTFIQLKVIGIK